MATEWDPINPLVVAILFQMCKAPSQGQFITPFLYQQKKS